MGFNDDPYRSEIETLVPRKRKSTGFEGLAPTVEEPSEDPLDASASYGVEAAWVEKPAPSSRR